MVVASSDFTCDGTSNGYWDVYDNLWNNINSSTNLISVNPTDLGSNNGVANVPAFWTAGAQNLSLQFLQSGTYHVVKHIGLTALGGNTLCTMDSDTITICIDTIPLVEVAEYIPDFVCLNTTISTSVFEDSVNCFDSTLYRFTVYNSSNSIIFRAHQVLIRLIVLHRLHQAFTTLNTLHLMIVVVALFKTPFMLLGLPFIPKAAVVLLGQRIQCRHHI